MKHLTILISIGLINEQGSSMATLAAIHYGSASSTASADNSAHLAPTGTSALSASAAASATTK